MRSAQYMGLSPRAEEEIARNGLRIVVSGKTYDNGWFDYRGGLPLHYYVRPSGEVLEIAERVKEIEALLSEERSRLETALLSSKIAYEEYLQGQPWSSGRSGPCSFLGLKDSNGNPVESLNWTEEEMDDA